MFMNERFKLCPIFYRIGIGISCYSKSRGLPIPTTNMLQIISHPMCMSICLRRTTIRMENQRQRCTERAREGILTNVILLNLIPNSHTHKMLKLVMPERTSRLYNTLCLQLLRKKLDII